MIHVVADTNALIMPFKRKFNLDAELNRLLGNYKLIVPEPIIGELERLADQSIPAKAALQLARQRESRPAEAMGDDSVLELALELKGIVLTNDIELIERCRASGIKVIRMREGSRLAFDSNWEG